MAALELVKKGKNFKIFKEGDQVLILFEKTRISFPAIGNMKEEESDDGGTNKKYKCSAMLPKATHDEAFKAALGVMNAIMAEKKVKIPTEYKFIKDGDASEREEYHEHWIVSMSETRRPVARNEAGNLMFDAKKIKDKDDAQTAFDLIDETFYAGAICDVLCRPWYFDGKVKGKTKTYPKRICGGITAIKFVEDDGVRFAGAGQIDTSSVWDSNDDGGSALDDDGGL